jgi:urease accessory protein
LLRQSLGVSGTDEAALGPAVLSCHRACGTLLRVDEALETASAPAASPASAGAPGPAPCVRGPGTGPWVAVMPLATGPATLATALAPDALTLRRLLPDQ